ncbi:unnamed protein product [Caenorhabditis bovis]|uniref:Chitinase n=1 Tax=Caenorhabditis bovis TaxID=2654633 RepID=A0A8S1ENR3_9PELO|nr:unnamed protein product [Caenorhabditis bovis]
MPEDYVAGLCTHILFAFGWMNEDFTVRAYDTADLPNDWAGDGMYMRVNALKKKDPALKTLLSFGGWSFGTRLFQGMAATAASRKVFIDSAILFVRKWGFDGIDLDWEYPSGKDDTSNFVALVKELRSACDAESKQSGRDRLLVTAAVASGQQTIDAGYDIPNLATSFDFILLMSYDFFGAWASLVGFNSPLYATDALPTEWKSWNVDFAARHWHEKGMPKEKIIVGMPTYGRGWTLKNVSDDKPGSHGSPAKITKYVQEAGVGSYFEFCEMLAKGATRHWDRDTQVPYLVHGDQWWSYDDEESFANKMAWLKREGYGGAFVWTLDFDDFNAKCSNSNGQLYPLISVIAKELGGVTIPKVTTKAPTTTTTTTSRPSTTPAPPKPGFNCAGKLNGHYPSTTDCNSFILCLDGSAYTMMCPAGLEYSAQLKHCAKPAVSKCKIGKSLPIIRSTVKPSVTLSRTTTKKPTATTPDDDSFKCEKDGFYGVVGNCLRFIRCVNGMSYNFECPNGLTFHNDSQMCDRPDESKCAK